jgi:poly-beta-1,6-N-acetyl-D-glucosamine synthase
VDEGNRLTVAATVVFLNEQQLLPRMLASLERQTRAPDLLLLLDDGSTDDSPALTSRFAERQPYARLISRPKRPQSADRLAKAAELIAFQWALEQLPEEPQFDVMAKLDADLELPPDFFERIMGAFEADPRLGIAGSELSVAADAGPAREHSQPWHVRGATKFYRSGCWRSIAPLPPILGWDTIDETRARIAGWRIQNVPFAESKPLHLRPTGSHDGAVRGFRRRGAAAWGYGAHPLNVLASALVRMRHRPLVVGGLAYLGGWLGAAVHRAPRAELETRRYLRREQLHRLQTTVLRGGVR